MAVSTKKRLKIEQRQAQVSELSLKGYSQTAIAKQLGVTQATVSNDLKAIREVWRASKIRDFDLNVSIELERLNLIEREMWEAWERSKKPSQSAALIGEGVTQPARKTLKNQNGDPRYLTLALHCHQSRRALLALDPPKRAEATQEEGRKLTLYDVLTHIEKPPPSPPAFIDPNPPNVIDVDALLRQIEEMPPEPAGDEPLAANDTARIDAAKRYLKFRRRPTVGRRSPRERPNISATTSAPTGRSRLAPSRRKIADFGALERPN